MNPRFALRNAVLVALSVSPPAFAQNLPGSTGGSSPNSLEEIVVTASKRDQRLIDVAGSISVQTGEAIDARRAQNMEDLFKVEPGVSFQKTSPDKSFPVIRGISTGNS